MSNHAWSNNHHSFAHNKPYMVQASFSLGHRSKWQSLRTPTEVWFSMMFRLGTPCLLQFHLMKSREPSRTGKKLQVLHMVPLKDHLVPRTWLSIQVFSWGRAGCTGQMRHKFIFQVEGSNPEKHCKRSLQKKMSFVSKSKLKLTWIGLDPNCRGQGLATEDVISFDRSKNIAPPYSAAWFEANKIFPAPSADPTNEICTKHARKSEKGIESYDFVPASSDFKQFDQELPGKTFDARANNL